ncbi:hypothetical protein NMG60_11036550 [Bertholletia excelsa]
MGMVVVLSLPLILFSILLGFGCYFLGRAKGRQEAYNRAQVFGVPTPPPGNNPIVSSSPTHFKPDNSSKV